MCYTVIRLGILGFTWSGFDKSLQSLILNTATIRLDSMITQGKVQ